MWMRWNDTSHIFEQSFNDGASWAVLPLNASVINEGAINAARLPPNVAYNNVNNNFTVNQTTFGLAVVGNNSLLSLTDTTGTVNARLWRFIQYNNGLLHIEALDDNQTIVQATPLLLGRAGSVVVGNALTVTNNLIVSAGGASITGQVNIVSGGLVVTAGGASITGGVSIAGGLTVSSGQTAIGPLNVNGGFVVTDPGDSSFVANVTGIKSVYVRNTNAGVSAAASWLIYNDNQVLGGLQGLSSGYTPNTGFNLPASMTLYSSGTGGLSLVTNSSTGTIRFYTSTSNFERMRITTGGQLEIGLTASLSGGWIEVLAPSGEPGLVLKNGNSNNQTNYVLFFNSANGITGNIAQLSANTIIYGTSSDARLKIDRGLATDLTALRKLRIHDFTWRVDDIEDRGAFAQEVYELFPRAVLKGGDEVTEDGNLKNPWMMDYGKLVADLIVGWQEHDREIAALKQFLRAKNN